MGVPINTTVVPMSSTTVPFYAISLTFFLQCATQNSHYIYIFAITTIEMYTTLQ